MASKDLRINEEITAREVRLIDDAGEQSVISLSDALAKAQEASLDLVEVSPAAVPPVCRILNYGKYKFEQEKRAKSLRKNQTIVKVKEIRMQAKISAHDLEFKAKHVWQFLNEGNKVKVTIRFKGRELAHTELGRVILDRMLEMILSITKEKDSVAFNLEQAPKMEGRNMNMLVAPKKE